MKLTDAQADKVKDAIGLEPFPEDAPVAAQLKEHFGDHTFFVAEAGLFVFEKDDNAEDAGDDPARAIQIAQWTEKDGQQALAVVEPQATTTTVDLAEAA
ncbi:MAG: hypothetical protein H2040_11325 [Euryhalocaulis sp.]|uniref:hypothetical protein n=1 Tax=Euryhalocaulis sp. TaxID=2744307 RepID=UPI00179A97C1|nr:hypothetical protein [Euryhalocaulis sp.]MBA4802444.1 hypothetical protein [Euryhalocaulis sp.]